MGNQPEDRPFWRFLVCCKGYVHPERHLPHPISRLGRNVVICNLVRIQHATSLHTSAQMVQKWPKNLQHCEYFMVFCLNLALARSLCAS